MANLNLWLSIHRKTDVTIQSKKPRYDTVVGEKGETCEITVTKEPFSSTFEGETLEEDVPLIKPMSPLHENVDSVRLSL